MDGITLETKIADLLNDYDGMKAILIAINPKFKKLNNPVLRRTLGRIATVRQAAIVGGMNPTDLVDQLRKAVGQEPICEGCEIRNDDCFVPETSPQPDWVNEANVAITLDANALLDADKNPLAEVRKALHKIPKGSLLKLIADFQPEPLIESFQQEGFPTWISEEDDGIYTTFIQSVQ
jgi:uncharacterized protein (DUF2249 family)